MKHLLVAALILQVSSASWMVNNIGFKRIGEYCRNSEVICTDNFVKFILKDGTSNNTKGVAHKTVKTYFLSTHMKASFINAQSFCTSLGMELLTLETKAEADWFAKLLINSYQNNIDSGWLYIGGMRMFPDAALSKENWYWLSSGKKIDYDLIWYQTEPNNWTGTQWCLCLRKENQTVFYADIECYGRDESFLCQSSATVKI